MELLGSKGAVATKNMLLASSGGNRCMWQMLANTGSTEPGSGIGTLESHEQTSAPKSEWGDVGARWAIVRDDFWMG